MYTAVARHAYYPLLDAYKRSPFRDCLAEAEANQRRPLEALRALQLRKLQRLLEHAEQHCPFYRDRFREHGLRAADLRTLDDLRRFPLTSKADLLDGYPRMVAARYQGKLFVGSTSGSTGTATRFGYDSGSVAWTEACLWRGRRWCGIDRGDRQLLLWSRPVDRQAAPRIQAWAKYRLRNYLQFNTFQQFDDARVDRVIAAIRRHRPLHIFGYGSSIARVARRLEERDETLAPPERPRVVEYTADHLHEPEKQVAERVFGARVVSSYGASECAAVAHECRHGNHHTSIDHAVVEFLRADGSPAEAGEVAEIVLTTLNNLGMPIIRYRVGDLGSWSAETCGCGVTLPLMRLQAGKVTDLVTTSTRERVSSHLFDYINIHLLKKEVFGIRQFLVEQTALDRFVLRLVRQEPFDARAPELFIDRMKAYLGDQIGVTVEFVDDIPLEPTGKRRYFRRAY